MKKITPHVSTHHSSLIKRSIPILGRADGFYHRLVESLDVYTVITTDLDGNISSWNSGAKKMFGYSEAEVKGKSASLIFTHADQKLDLLKKILANIYKNHRIERESYYLKKNGAHFWGVGVIFPLEDENGEQKGLTFIIQDQTEQKGLEKRKDDFISTATHELKTPVTSVKLFAELLARHAKKINDQVGMKSMEQLNQQLDRLTALMNYLLDVSKIQRNRLELDKTNFNLNNLVRELLSSIQTITPNHTLTQRGGAPYEVLADRGRIEQVLTNILTNSIKYSPNGGEIVIEISQSPSMSIVSVKDTGLGIAKAEQGAIFDRFYRAGSAIRNNINGIGLGLYVAQRIIKAHNGKTWLNSNLGKGSTFYFSIPRKKEEAGSKYFTKKAASKILAKTKK